MNTLPTDITAESATLGCLLIATDSNVYIVDDVAELLGRDGAVFSKPAHQTIYRAIMAVYERDQTVDAMLVVAELRSQGTLQEIGGYDELIRIAESVPIPDHAVHYAKIVLTRYRERAYIKALHDRLADTAASIDERIEATHEALYAITDTNDSDGVSTSDVIDEIDAELHDGPAAGIPTGLHDYDDLTSGLRDSEVTVLAARASMGKTAMMLNIACHIAVDQQQPVAIFSMEMGRKMIGYRLLADLSGVSLPDIQQAHMGQEQRDSLDRARRTLRETPMIVDDTSMLTPISLRSRTRRYIARDGVSAIFIDYLQLMNDPEKDRRGRQEEVASLSRRIKMLSRDLNVPIVLLAQVNRQSEHRSNHRPSMADLRESGAIEQDADVIAMIHREEYYASKRGAVEYEQWRAENPHQIGTAELIVAKNRNGPTGTANLRWDSERTRFENTRDLRYSEYEAQHLTGKPPSA